MVVLHLQSQPEASGKFSQPRPLYTLPFRLVEEHLAW